MSKGCQTSEVFKTSEVIYCQFINAVLKFSPGENQLTDYDLKSLKLPKLTGAGLKAFTAALENPLSRALLLPGLLENGGIPKLRRITVEEPPTLFPLAAGGDESARSLFNRDRRPRTSP